MSIIDSKVKNVLMKVFAANEEPAITEDAVKSEDRAAGGAPIITRHYIYEVSKGNDILFSNIIELVKDKPEEMAEKLTTGTANVGAHFKWVAVIIKTNVWGKGNEGVKTHKDTFVHYLADLNTDGSVDLTTGEILTEDKSDTRVTDEFLSSNSVFVKGKDVPRFVNLEDEPTSAQYYPAAGSLKAQIIKGTARGLPYDRWEQSTFGLYRMWVANLGGGKGGLRLPDCSIPNDGKFTYMGTPESIAELEKITKVNIRGIAKGEPTKEDLADKEEPENDATAPRTPTEKTEDGVFAPVDEQKNITKEDAKIKYASKKQKTEKGDYSSGTYGGGFSIMQNLVKDQKENMKIRKAAQRVVVSSISSTNTSTSSSGSSTDNKIPDSQKINKATSAMKGFNKEVKEFNSLTKSADDNVKQASVGNVLKKYLN